MSEIQTLLDIEAMIGNAMYRSGFEEVKTSEELMDARKMVWRLIEVKRGAAPVCYGLDDCSTLILSMCPWRMTCGKE